MATRQIDDPTYVQVIGGFGTVFVDQSYWQSAIAAKPSASWKGYLLGGLMWFSIPFALATSLGLSVVALDLPLTIDEGNLGLVPPAAALAILGNGGAILVVMACFSDGCLYLRPQIHCSTRFAYGCVWQPCPLEHGFALTPGPVFGGAMPVRCRFQAANVQLDKNAACPLSQGLVDCLAMSLTWLCMFVYRWSFCLWQ